MSLVSIIEKLEAERALNDVLVHKLLEQLDADILRIEEKRQTMTRFFDDERARLIQRKTDLETEFAERDAAFLRLIDGDQKPLAFAAVKAGETSNAELAA